MGWNHQLEYFRSLRRQWNSSKALQKSRKTWHRFKVSVSQQFLFETGCPMAHTGLTVERLITRSFVNGLSGAIYQAHQLSGNIAELLQKKLHKAEAFYVSTTCRRADRFALLNFMRTWGFWEFLDETSGFILLPEMFGNSSWAGVWPSNFPFGWMVATKIWKLVPSSRMFFLFLVYLCKG